MCDGARLNLHSALNRGNKFGINVNIGPNVMLGRNNDLGNNCSITGKVIIGDNNVFATGVSIGCPARQRVQNEPGPWISADYEPTIRIGSNNFFEDYVTVQEPLLHATEIGNFVALGAFTRICHDGIVRDKVTAASSCAFGGYVQVGIGANIGMGVVVHQRTAIGAWAMLGAGAVIVKHVVPGAVVCGVPASYIRPNILGLERAQFNKNEVDSISAFLSKDRRDSTLPEMYKAELDSFVADVQKWERMRPMIPREVT